MVFNCSFFTKDNITLPYRFNNGFTTKGRQIFCSKRPLNETARHWIWLADPNPDFSVGLDPNLGF